MVTKNDYALLLGRYCGYRWASECSDEQRQFYERHRVSARTFDELCVRLAPGYSHAKFVADHDYLKDALYLTFAAGMRPAMDELDQLPEFLHGFCHDADLVFERQADVE